MPGFGVVRRTYGGPTGELTRLWVDGYVDSIGGVNPELHLGYGRAGQRRCAGWTRPTQRRSRRSREG